MPKTPEPMRRGSVVNTVIRKHTGNLALEIQAAIHGYEPIPVVIVYDYGKNRVRITSGISRLYHFHTRLGIREVQSRSGDITIVMRAR